MNTVFMECLEEARQKKDGAKMFVRRGCCEEAGAKQVASF